MMFSTIAIPAFLWALAGVLFLLRRSRVRSITYAVMAIALATTLNIDPLYAWFDGLIGHRNVGDLLANWSLIAGVFFLARGVAQAYEFSNRAVRILLGPVALMTAAMGMTLAFLFIEAPETSTRFMADFGSQPAAVAYSVIQYTYLGAAMGAMMRVSWEQARSAHGSLRLFTWTLTCGSAIAVALAGTVIGMDLANVLGRAGVLRALQSAYDLLWPLAFIVIGFGLLGPPIQRWNSRVSYRRRTRRHSCKVRETWKKTSGDRPGLRGRDELDDLRQMILYIRDSKARAGEELSAEDEKVISAAEQHLANPPASIATMRLRPLRGYGAAAA